MAVVKVEHSPYPSTHWDGTESVLCPHPKEADDYHLLKEILASCGLSGAQTAIILSMGLQLLGPSQNSFGLTYSGFSQREKNPSPLHPKFVTRTSAKPTSARAFEK